MKRILHGTTAFALLALGCSRDIPIDDPAENPGVQPPLGVIRGSAAYLGPAPCIRNGQIEGALVLLLFDASNPPPPNGLATTALNFTAIPGEALFANFPRPTKGPGSPQQPDKSLCGAVDAPPVSAVANWSMRQVPAGRYIVQAFYSQHNRFNALFDFANLPLAGDTPGAALVDPLAADPQFATIEVGVPARLPDNCVSPSAADKAFCEQKKADIAAGRLEIPSQGFLREGVSVNLGGVFRTNRPYFHINYAGSRSFANDEGAVAAAKDFADNYNGQRKLIVGADAAAQGFVSFPQDHASTSLPKTECLGAYDSTTHKPDYGCDLFEIAQGSFPQIRVNYGFPGDANNSAAAPSDAWIAKNAKPKDPFDYAAMRPYYGSDPKELVADIPTSGSFVLTRNFDAKGSVIVEDNRALKDTAAIADLFPQVVLAKLAEDAEGNILWPARPQTDPVVVIQGITLRDIPNADAGTPKGTGSMKATSQSPIAAGGLTVNDGTTATPDPNAPLNKKNGFELQSSFTALLRPSTLCVHPEAGFRGVLVTPLLKDPNPLNTDQELVTKSLVLASKGNLVKDIQFGCLPPGHYAVNVVYATGQAWSLPNLMGQCSADARFQPNEDCQPPGTDPNKVATFPQMFNQLFAKDPKAGGGFPVRPLIASQMVYQTDANGAFILDANKKKIPQIVTVAPSPRCGSLKKETDVTCDAGNPKGFEKCPVPFEGACVTHTDGKGYCDLNGDGKISTAAIWVNNPVNEDIALDMGTTTSDKSANGLLDPGEDVNGDGKLQMNVPAVCALPYGPYSSLKKAGKAN